MIHARGDVYAGDWKNGKLNGKCELSFVDKSSFKGHYNFEEDCGLGCLTWPNGDRYEGELHKLNKHGKGKYQYANGTMYNG